MNPSKPAALPSYQCIEGSSSRQAVERDSLRLVGRYGCGAGPKGLDGVGTSALLRPHGRANRGWHERNFR